MRKTKEMMEIDIHYKNLADVRGQIKAQFSVNINGESYTYFIPTLKTSERDSLEPHELRVSRQLLEEYIALEHKKTWI